MDNVFQKLLMDPDVARKKPKKSKQELIPPSYICDMKKLPKAMAARKAAILEQSSNRSFPLQIDLIEPTPTKSRYVNTLE
jgi:hypothetical protein